jgi:hypothetical protein
VMLCRKAIKIMRRTPPNSSAYLCSALWCFDGLQLGSANLPA